MSQISDTLIDAIFDGRYRILRKLGAGGMASVYLAQDDELGRRVAIKVLNDRYAGDELFVERFRREAKSAAGLSHPNIVSIYDRGEAEGTYYIAMEVVEGKSLKEIIRTNGRLRPAQAIAYARQILSALRFAHRNGIIHRDIKPHNILVGPEERLKVTDFGIARAGASQMTETGSIMGTAQYLSPEQARGARVTAGSDVYSVGIVLYEMLTGAVPFTGDTAVEIAMKHVGETPHPPSATAPGIPADLDRVVLRALAKNPAERYQSAEEFDSDLSLIEAGLPIARETTEAATAVLRGGPPPSAATEVLQPREDARQPPRRVPPRDPYAPPPRRRRSLFPWLLALLLLAGAAVAGWYVYQRVQDELSAREPVAVPNVVGLKQNRAVDLIERADLQADVQQAFSDAAPAGEVIDQDPNAGTRIQKGETVTINVSAGVEQVQVPKVVGADVTDAISTLNDAGLDYETRAVFSDKPVNTVTKQNPKPGASVDKGSTVVVNVSQGVQTVAVPDVLDQFQDSARAELEQAGFAVSVNEVEDDSQAGLVVGQDPDPGIDAEVGSTVTIAVSTGPQTVSVPSVLGVDEASAQSALQDAGFAVEVVDDPVFLPSNDGLVTQQDPGPGAEVDPGTTVTIYVGRFVFDGGSDTTATAPAE